MVTRRRFLVLLGAGGLTAGAVAVGVNALPDDEQSDRLPNIRYGEERCFYCGMDIGDPRFASAWRTMAGTERHFDDIGCMVDAYRRDHPAAETSFYVHDLNDESWLPAPDAAYVVSPTVKTPMAYGVAAFASGESARAAAGDPAARVYDWTQLLNSLQQKDSM